MTAHAEPVVAGPSQQEGPALAARTRGLRKTYGRTVAVDHVDLDVPEGAVLGMLGPNGSGKTTTIRMLLGLVQPTEGEVQLLGHTMPERAGDALPDVGALVEGPGFHPFLSGRENLLRLAAAEPRLTAAGIPPAVDDALERVGLSRAGGRRYRGYSLGMKQRLGLAGALLVPRRLVVLDEPTNGLDPAGTREIRSVIADLHHDGVTVLVSSHLLAEVEATCTHVAVLNEGALVAQGDLTELLESESAGLEVSTTDVTAAVEALRAAHLAARPTPDGVRVELTRAAAPDVIATLVGAGVPVYEARRSRTGLEDLFARLTQDSEEAPTWTS
ncbi:MULTISPECIES: ABC transporter ATP-binding protein [Prauserella salsuginis group]|uniref:ABC-2 type transport system ATP-binding protein n=2 Tax=Prauserella salsuginis group TaxID=2893672 RepID=A0A839XTB8_9PSEU|nr:MULTISPECIES: ABC transporter ATP-binding protein [Prauserella salsuginis group]MBB3663843.1 ABC-2 type transport system ATP-binding protein [Prauserella sediminis]MCR3722375.1 ABC-2 type transport system ATP-binding protein [Prauserella flava]MCR3736817.1 ABC-2 type transport system ATP-binding protein [Prauserella salsuginis]